MAFIYSLASRLGMSVTQICNEMPEHEREGWLAYMSFEQDVKKNG